MNASFYTAARGAMTEQEKMNVISNNMAMQPLDIMESQLYPEYQRH